MQELKIVIEVFHMVFGAIYQDHFFKFKNFYFSLHPNVHNYNAIPLQCHFALFLHNTIVFSFCFFFAAMN